ncbi:MAG TPA: RNA polymerase sigma factor [Terriglobales bacterium]|jgi:RNA polymerase sigma-70 factor (ECF subfamily)|nr:RNA polymerase sigma factor [Terriglobales bacterium]
MVSTAEAATSQEPLSDEEVVARVLAGETGMFEVVMRRHNQRLYSVARAILRNDGEAEDVMQDAYVRAYEHLNQFAGRAKFSTWLTRIAVHEALARQRRGNRYQELEPMSEREGDPMDRFASLTPNPEQQASNSEIRRLLEEAVDNLPDSYRTVFMLRDIEEMSTTDAADVLEITEENVKVRLHRARALLRKSLYARAGMQKNEAFNFHAIRCDRVVKNVFERIQKLISKTEGPAARIQ